MVLALFEGLELSKGLREAIPFLNHIVTDNPELGNQNILDLAREAGLRFTDGPARVIVNQIKSDIKAFQLFNVEALDELPSLRSFGKIDSPLTKNYSFGVKITGYNSLTGERETRNITVVSNELLTPAQIYADALNLPNDKPGSSILSNSVMTIVNAKKSKYAP